MERRYACSGDKSANQMMKRSASARGKARRVLGGTKRVQCNMEMTEGQMVIRENVGGWCCAIEEAQRRKRNASCAWRARQTEAQQASRSASAVSLTVSLTVLSVSEIGREEVTPQSREGRFVEESGCGTASLVVSIYLAERL